MKQTIKIVSLMMMAIGLVWFVGCAQEEEEEQQDPLVGTWVMNNLEQSSVYTAAADIATIGISAGDTLGAGTMTWAQFSALGVSATVALEDDGTFTLTGNLPVSNDTLGFAPSIVPLTDNGTWSAAADYSTLLIDGSLYDIGGALTMDDPDNPTTISLYYTATEADTVVLPVDVNADGIPDMFLDNIPINEASATTLGFAKQ
jgi:hypothetical protein